MPAEARPAEARPAEAKPPEVASSPEGAPPAGRGEESAPSPADLAAAHRNRPRPEAEAATTPAADPEEPVSVPASGREPAERDAERGLRGLVGSGSSQVGVWAAARARDAARPTDEDVRAAEQLPLVRRNWVPREPFRPNTRRS